MKKLSYLALAAVGLLLGACSSDKDVVGQDVTEEVGDGYIAVSVNLPTTIQTITRATDDNGSGKFDLDDGLESEYAVNDVHLLIFTPGASEDAATFKTAFNLTTVWPANADPHVTVNSAKLIKKVGSTVAKNDLALVVLNANSIYTFTNKTSSTVGEQTVSVDNAGTSVTLDNSITFGDLRKYIVTNSAIDNASQMTTTSFYMTNSPLYTKKGSTHTDDPSGTGFRTLVPITNVYPTEAEAASGTADEIFVERGMAKVTLKQLASGSTLETKDKDGNDLDITILGWSLDQTNQKSYFIRSTDNTATYAPIINGVSKIYRFTGNTAILDANNPGDYKYRSYFAEDPNFAVATSELTHSATLTYSTGFGVDNPQYCFENTFDVAHQLRMHTTLAQLKVQVGDGATNYYTVNGSTSNIYKLADVETIIKNAVFNHLKTKGLVGTATSADLGAVTLTNGTPASLQVIDAVAVTDDGTKFLAGAAAEVTADLASTSSKIKAAVGDIVKYDKGVSYYAIRIKHFGDELTPWHVGTVADPIPATLTWLSIWDNTAAAKEATLPTAGNIYPDNNANDYLGRYGMLRNNWYDLEVNKIKTLGSAEPIDYTTDPTEDDELDGYISVKINVLSWARRTQKWDL